MKTHCSIMRALTVTTVFVCVACGASDATEPLRSADVANVTVRLAAPRPVALNGFEEPPDTVKLVADVRDGYGDPMPDRIVTWQLQLADGTRADDSIASIVSTGAQTASFVFQSHAEIVGIIASVPGNDGVSRSGRLYLAWTP